METLFVKSKALSIEGSTDPTYKEWKQLEDLIGKTTVDRTDPTYKEWKPAIVFLASALNKAHGSYLQGMETCWRQFCA